MNVATKVSGGIYDVVGGEVQVLRILAKADVNEYLKEMGYEIEDL